MGKAENVGYQSFLLFPKYFLPIQKTNFNFLVMFTLASAIAFKLDQSEIVLFGKKFTLSQTTNFRLFQTERVCRRQFQIDENIDDISKGVENTGGKEDIACDEKFLLFP